MNHSDALVRNKGRQSSSKYVDHSLHRVSATSHGWHQQVTSTCCRHACVCVDASSLWFLSTDSNMKFFSHLDKKFFCFLHIRPDSRWLGNILIISSDWSQTCGNKSHQPLTFNCKQSLPATKAQSNRRHRSLKLMYESTVNTKITKLWRNNNLHREEHVNNFTSGRSTCSTSTCSMSRWGYIRQDTEHLSHPSRDLGFGWCS